MSDPDAARRSIQTAQVKIDLAEADLERALAALEDVPTVPTKQVLQPPDIRYLGPTYVPEDVPNAIRFGYSRGALTYRLVDGHIHFLMCGATAETGWNDPVYEFTYAGVGQRGVMVHNWGDVTKGRRTTAAGNANTPIHGLLFDPETLYLLWTYLDGYNVTGAWDPCLGVSALDPSGVRAAGPWRLGDHSQRVGGYLVPRPGGGFAAGAPIGSGNYNAPWGAWLSAFTLPPPGTPPDAPGVEHVTIPTTHLITSDIDHRQPREPDADECGWTHYGQADSKGAQPQWNGTQDGRGCTVNGELCGASFAPLTHFSAVDTISAAAWIDTPTKHGLVMVGQLARTMAAHAAEYGARARCDVWYGPPQEYGVKKLSPYGQNDVRYGPTATGPGVTTMQSSLFIYDPAALGVKAPQLLPPVVDAFKMDALPHDGTPFPALVSAMHAYGGACFVQVEPGRGLLFISDIHGEWLGEWRPIIHVLEVAI